MKRKGFARMPVEPFLVPSDFDYGKRRGVYVFGAYSPDIEFDDLIDKIEGMVLFPNVSPVFTDKGLLYRRSDGAWLVFKDEVTNDLVMRVCNTVQCGGRPPQMEWAVSMYVRMMQDRGAEEGDAIARAAFAVTQAYATGALGEFSLSDLGYEVPGGGNNSGGDEFEEENAEGESKVSLYAGRLALWEVGEIGEAPHTLYCHAFRRIYVSSQVQGCEKLLDELDGRSIMNAIEYLCRLKDVKGYPHPEQGEAAYRIARLLEAGVLVFQEEYPDPYPHT